MVDESEAGYPERLIDAMGGMSTQVLANHLGISYQAVKKVLSGGTKYFILPNHYKAADLLGVNPRWLATGEGERTPSKPPGLSADWRTVALSLAQRHPHESKRIELADFIRRVDQEFASIKNPTRLAGIFTEEKD